MGGGLGDLDTEHKCHFAGTYKMLFSAPDFLFGFLPLFLFIYAIAGCRLRNLVLFLSSLSFYFVTAGELTVILGLSVIITH